MSGGGDFTISMCHSSKEGFYLLLGSCDSLNINLLCLQCNDEVLLVLCNGAGSVCVDLFGVFAGSPCRWDLLYAHVSLRAAISDLAPFL